MNATAPRLNDRNATSDAANRRHNRRAERSFGTGYGRSSGYANSRNRYAPTEASERFRVH